MAHHRQSAGHWATVRAECASILVHHASSVLVTGHAGQVHALHLVRVVRS